MKSYENDDELERALFSLELEEPPADLRASILAATVYRAPLPFKPWEIWAVGILGALLTWLLVLVAQGAAVPAFSQLDLYLNEGIAAFAAPATIFWIALGGGAALWISQLNLTLAPGVERTHRR